MVEGSWLVDLKAKGQCVLSEKSELSEWRDVLGELLLALVLCKPQQHWAAEDFGRRRKSQSHLYMPVGTLLLQLLQQ